MKHGTNARFNKGCRCYPCMQARKTGVDQVEERRYNLRYTLLKHLVEAGRNGLTDAESQQMMQLKGDSQRPRRRELIKAELVKNSGKQRGDFTVWVVTPEGRKLWKELSK